MRAIAVAAVLVFGFIVGSPGEAQALAGDGIAASVPIFTQVATLVGPAPLTQQLRLVVHLAYPHPRAVEAFVRSVNDPNSRSYGSFLSPSQFGATFGPTGHSYSTVEYAVTNAGMSVYQTYNNLKTLDIVGSVWEAEALFNTTINEYTYNGVTYYANGSPAYVPVALKGLLMAVSGFTNFAQKVAQPPGSHAVGYGPLEIERAYNEPISMRP